MRKYLITVLIGGVLVIGVALFWHFTKQQPSAYMKKLQDDVTSYEVSGTLEFVDEESLKKINVQTLYKKVDECNCYYVRLEDETTKQIQTIIKNNDGVFVLAQGFNRAFKFNSDWPNNGFKPYILENIFQLFNNAYEEKKIRDGYIVKAQLDDLAQPNISFVKVLFNQNEAMTQVVLFDEGEQEMIRFNVQTYILNPNIESDLFTINSQENLEVGAVVEGPLYPTHLFETELIDQLTINQGHMLRYKGEHYFTLVEKTLKKANTFEITEINGEFYVHEDGFLYIDEEQVVKIQNGLQTTLYSNDLSIEEKIRVLMSLENNIVIER